MDEQKRLRKGKVTTVVLLILTAVFAVLCVVLGLFLLKESRINRFSKNINLGNNYFISDYQRSTDDEEDIDEGIECLTGDEFVDFAGAEAEYAVNTKVQYDSYFCEMLTRLYEVGYIDTETLNEIIQYADSNGIYEAAQYANKIFGEEIIILGGTENKLDVPCISQNGILPNGCEAVSAVMLLAYRQKSVDPIDFCDKYLDKGEIYIKWGCRYGPNPMVKYAGDPKSENGGWGCFAPVIVKSLKNCIGNDSSLAVKNLTGTSLETLVNKYIMNGIPVAVWVSQDMDSVESFYQWQSYDKSETFLYPVREHCVVLTGFDGEYYYCNDPLKGKDIKYKKEDTAAAFAALGRQAVAVVDKQETAHIDN